MGTTRSRHSGRIASLWACHDPNRWRGFGQRIPSRRSSFAELYGVQGFGTGWACELRRGGPTSCLCRLVWRSTWMVASGTGALFTTSLPGPAPTFGARSSGSTLSEISGRPLNSNVLVGGWSDSGNTRSLRISWMSLRESSQFSPGKDARLILRIGV